ncbi:hypothetical protein D3C78_1496890 [compost metagenome]
MVAVEAQLLAGLVGQLYLHPDHYVTAAQHEAELILLVVAARPGFGSEQQGALQGHIDQLGRPLALALHQAGRGQIEDPGKVAALGHAHLRSALERSANKSCSKV